MTTHPHTCCICSADLTGKTYNQRFGIGVDLRWCSTCPAPARPANVEAKLAKLGARGAAPAPIAATVPAPLSDRKDGKRELRAALPDGGTAKRFTANRYMVVVAGRHADGEWLALRWSSTRRAAEKAVAAMESMKVRFNKPGCSCMYSRIEEFRIVPVLA